MVGSIHIFEMYFSVNFSFPYGLYVHSIADTNRIIRDLKWLLIKIDTFNEIYLSRKSEIFFVIFSICNEIVEGKIYISVICSACRVPGVRICEFVHKMNGRQHF
jgi:hypothetical protein